MFQFLSIIFFSWISSIFGGFSKVPAFLCHCICSDSQAALKALQAAETTSPLVRQCQQALNDISTRHAVGLYWIPGHAGVRGNEITDKVTRDGSVHQFVGLESFLGVSRQNDRRR